MRYIISRIVLLAAVLGVLGLSRTAAAAPLLPGTLADYMALGSGGGTIDDKLFFDFGYLPNAAGGAIAIPASEISVTPISTPLNPGLRFSAAWTVGPGQALDSFITFQVSVLPGGAPITDISARMDDFGISGDGFLGVSEVTTSGELFLFDSALGIKAFDDRTFAPTTGPISVTKDVFLLGGRGGSAGVSSVTNQFSELPEPSALVVWLLLGPLVIALRWWRRR